MFSKIQEVEIKFQRFSVIFHESYGGLQKFAEYSGKFRVIQKVSGSFKAFQRV